MARARDNDIPIYGDSEWQADRFAGALLVPRKFLEEFGDDVHAAAKACGMSPAAAGYQLKLYKRDDE